MRILMRINAIRGSRMPASRQHYEARGGKEGSDGLVNVDDKGASHHLQACKGHSGLKRGDLVSWELEVESLRLRVVPPIDLGYLSGVQAGLTEWGSDEDDVAFADL